ncbi:hypothetical protein DFQ26_003129 [Actinomortierella ambigua]|nr:hypothetical protein DFQ26_003129 [Actinomortierella ambigua]
MPHFLIQFAQQHEEFRLPELEALATIEDVEIIYNPEDYSLESPFLIVEIESEEKAARLLKRAILIKTIIELWGKGSSWDDLADKVKQHPERWPQYMDVSFKFSVVCFGGTIEMKDKPAIINRFAFTGFRGKIMLKNPDVEFLLIADCGLDPDNLIPHTFYMGKLIGHGKRDLIDMFNVKKRKYIGNTTMDAELSLIMANQALCVPGKLVYDPFVGTGSFLMTCAHFGAMTVGSDIDGRQIRGKGKTSIRSNAQQYNVEGRVMDALVFDVCHSPWRNIKSGIFDAIVTDPPYGVRAGAKTLGRKDPLKQATEPKMLEDGEYSHTKTDYIPPTKPYEMSEVVADLLMFAVKNLVVGGRLVYWLPTVTEEYSIDDLPTHPSMELIANCEQSFGQWSRRLITMEKVAEWDGKETLGPPTGEMSRSKTSSTNSIGHFGFRDKYFAFGNLESSRRKKILKELYDKGGREAVRAYMKSEGERKRQEAAATSTANVDAK